MQRIVKKSEEEEDEDDADDINIEVDDNIE